MLGGFLTIEQEEKLQPGHSMSQSMRRSKYLDYRGWNGKADTKFGWEMIKRCLCNEKECQEESPSSLLCFT